jgi:hypothetical protein
MIVLTSLISAGAIAVYKTYQLSVPDLHPVDFTYDLVNMVLWTA